MIKKVSNICNMNNNYNPDSKRNSHTKKNKSNKKENLSDFDKVLLGKMNDR